MSSIKYIFCLLIALLLPFAPALATHNRAGEITFRQLGELSYEVTLITYTDSKSVQADRAEVEIFWGDSTSDIVKRFPPDFDVAPNTQRNVYRKVHTYPGPGSYIIRFFDPNRIDAIKNINNSVSVPFYIESLLVIDKKKGFNQSPQLLQPPIDVACVNKIFRHNPNAYDADGDSLVFTIIPPKRDVGKDVPGFTIPAASNSFSIDKHTGELVWDSPKEVGIFNIAILIEEYRKGQRIGYIIRDMQITVDVCKSNPPVLDPLKDTCVEAGSNVHLQVLVNGRDVDNDQISLKATGGPFLQQVSPATFSTPGVGKGVIQGKFDWDISCTHIRKQPYRVVFKVEEQEGRATILSDLKHMDIRVVGPAPLQLTAAPFGNGVNLAWQKPVCANAIGYLVYRRADSSHWLHDYCETGVPGYTGFRLIDTITNPNTLTYYDINKGIGLAPGINYCYVVTAIYLNQGQYEFAEGYASNEACARLKKDVPVMTHVSVEATDELNGKIRVVWSKPTEIDTQQTPGPYLYKLYRSEGLTGGNYQLLKTYTSPLFSGLNDSIFLDSGLNTLATGYTYKVDFYYTFLGTETFIGTTVNASSVFLKIRRAHEKLELRWEEYVPWTNIHYTIYKLNGAQQYDSIGASASGLFVDTGLVNGDTYCYYVKATGSYFSAGFTDPLINLSQIVCSSPRDTIKPCAPALTADADCDTRTTYLRWSITDTCTLDIDRFKIYFSPDRDSNFVLVDSVMNRESVEYTDTRPELSRSLAGCYAITAVDTSDNESAISLMVCVDNCPIYELPNVFTPNKDGRNDLWRPMQNYRFIDHVDMEVYNRWGQLVFRTQDPALNWDGSDTDSGKALADGVYYYICTVYEKYLDGNVARTLRGTVSILH